MEFLIYILCAGIFLFVTGFLYDAERDQELVLLSCFGAIFWPAATPLVLAIFLGKHLIKIPQRVRRNYIRKHRERRY